MQDGQFRGFNLPQANSGADFDLFRAIFGTVQGFISGFTTIPFGEEPKNSGEAIFRNVGHLLGFMGYIPGPGSLGKLGATAVANVVGRTGLVAKGLVTAGKVAQGVGKVAEFSSVPMMGANLIMKGMERYGLSKAGGLATRFMEKRLGTKAGVVFENAIKSGIHLGLASGISAAPPWQLAVDQRMEAFMGGFGAGAFFGGTGELLPTKGITANDNILQQIMKSVKDPKGVARILSTTAYMGLPSTLSQDPIELQVYAYLQGALFGSTSLAQHDKDAIAFIRGQHQESNTPQFLLNRMLLDPEKMNGWKELTPKAQETVKEQVNLMHIKYLATADNITFASGSQAKALKEIVDTASKELEELDLNRSKYSDKEYQERKERLVASMTNADDADHFIKYLEDHKDKSVEENWDNFGKEVIAANAREMSMSLETIRANQNKEMQDKLYGNLAEGTPDGKEISQLNQYMTDVKKMPPIYREPVRMLAKGLMGKDQSVEGRIQKQKEIVDLIDEHRGNWDEMISAFNKKYNVKLEPSTRTHTNEAYNALRNAYITEKYVIPSPLPQLSVDPVTGKTYEIKYTNANGDNVAQYKANPFMKKVLEEAFKMSDIGFRNVKYVRVRKTLKSGATVEADEPIYDGNFDFLKTSEEMHKQGMTIFGGVKDDANLIAIKYLLPGDTMALKKIAANKILEDFFQKEPDAKKVFDELWEARKKELNLPDGHQRLLTQLEIYQMQYANNIKALEAINGGVSIHEILKGDGFIKSPVALNKRLSLLNNGFIPLDKEYFKERPYFKTAIVRAVPGKRGRDESDDFTKSIVEGKEDIWEYRLNSQGKLVKKKMDTDRDGVIYLHDKVFDKLTQFAGLEVGTGAQKGTLTHTDSNGALFGKYAYHRAGSELSKAMEEHGLDSIIYDTAAKQTGKRTVHDMKWNSGKLEFSGKDFYDLPVESFTITNAGEHLRSQMKESYFVSQFLSNLDNRMPQTSGWIKREMEKVVNGDKYHNAIARNYLAGKSKNIDKLDISKISHEIKLKILFGGQNNELYRKLIDHYLKRDKETMVDEDDLPLNFNQEKVYRDALDRPQSGAERLLQLWKLNPQKAMSRPLQSYINTIIASQMKAELFRPRAEGSWRSKLAPLGILNGKYDLKPGEVLLDKALGKKEIPWVDNTKITIKKALELRDKEQDPMVKEQMDEALSVAFQRVPTSALSGVRILKIKALTDIDGSGVRLHPKDMVNADGADLDIDGGYIYTNLPKMVKDEFRNVQNEWYDYYDIKTGKKLDSRYVDKLGWKKIKELVDKGELAEVYSDPKSGDDFVDKPRMNKYLKDKYAMLDPYTLMEANKNAYKGNELLGLGVGIARHINAMLMDRKDIDPKAFLRAKRSLINYAADAADGIPLINKERVGDVLIKAAFGDRIAHGFEVLTNKELPYKNRVSDLRDEGYQGKELANIQGLVGEFYDNVKLNRVVKGKDQDGNFSLGEMSNLSQSIGYEPSNPYYRAGWLVGNWGNALDRLDYLPGISDKGGEMNQRIVNVWSRTKGFKELIGRYAVNVLNKSMRSKAFKEKETISHFDAFQYANELNSQDLWDALSIKLIREFAPKNYDPMIVEKIRRDVFALKIKLREAMQQRREAGFTSGGAKQAIEAEYIKLKQGFQGVPEYLDLIDAYMVSSLYPQEMNLEAYMKQDKPSLFWQSAIEETRGKINQRQKDGQPVSELKQHLKELEDNYEQAQIEAKQAWYYTNTDAVGYEMQSVSNKVLIRAGELYDEIAVMRDRQLSDHDIREIDEYVDNSKLTEDLEVSDMPTFKSDFIYKVKDIAAKYEEELKKSPDPQLEKASDVILKFFQKYPNKIKDYQAIFEGDMFRRGLETGMPGAIAPNIASPQDVIDFANTLESIMQSKGNFRKLRRMDYARSFGSIGNEMLASEPGSYVTKVPVLVDNTMLPKFKEVRVMQSTFGKVNGFWKKEDELTSGSYQKIDNSFENTYKLRNWLNEQEHGLGDKMYAYMFANAEKEVGFKLSQEDNNEHYRRYETMKAEGEKMLSSDKKYRAPWMKEEKTLRQIFDDLNLWMEETNRRQADEYIRGQKAVEKFILKYKMRYDLFLPNSEFLNLKGLKKALTEEWNSSKPLMLGWDMLNRIYWQEHVESIKIDPVKFFNTYFNTRGRRMAEEWVQLQDEFKSDVKVESTEPSPVVEFKDLTALTSHPLFHEIGKTIFVGKHPLDIVAKVLYGRMTAKDPVYDTKVSELLDDNAKATLLNMMNKDGKLNYQPIQLMDFKTRVPHMDHDPKEVKVWLENRLLSLKATSAKPQDLILAKMNALETLDRSNLQSVEYAANLEDMLNRGGITTEEAKTFRMKAGTTLHRSQEDPTPGWSLMPEIFAKSEKQLISNYNKGIAAWLSHRNLKEIEINKSLGENTEAWTVFGHQYVRRNVGLPSLFPKEWLDKKEYFIKNNPYYYLTDQYWVDRLEGQMSRHFGGKSPFSKILKDFSKEELEKLTPRDLAAIKKFQSASVTRMIGKFSELEAKWSFLSLLTHSKTMVANIFGGSQLTMASTGLRNFLQARDYNYLRENVFLDAKSKADIDKIAEENGSIESLFKSEVTLNNYFKTGRGKDFAEEIVRYIDRGGKLDEDVMRKYAKQYGVSDVLMNTGGWFMRKSEIMLRKHAWFAHYLNAWKTLGMTALDMPADHPWLIDWANRGVAATQFLYNTASRPAFASTTLGRVFTRFQMWTWNSLKFRTDVFKIAGEHGIRPGSAEFNRARRLLTMDLFVLGLAGLFPSTLFENTLAPPFNYFTNLSQYFFGDDDQKKRAFFGSMPYPFNILQMGLPPSSRVLTGTFKFIWDGDMDAYGRQVISWVPFGRFANDIRKTYESPIMGINNLTGFPSVQLQRVVNKSNKEEEKGTKRESPLPKSLINHLLF